MADNPGLTLKPCDKPTMERFIDAFRARAIRDPGSVFAQGLLEAANVLQRCLPADRPPPEVTKWVRLDIDELRGVKPG